MDIDGDGTVAVSSEVRRTGARRYEKFMYDFTQQSLPSCKPVLTPVWVISTFLLMGIICIPIGFISLSASQSVVEIVERYDIGCIPETFRGNKVGYIKNSSISKNCSLSLEVPRQMKAPIYIYYQLDNYYQNHRRYVKSRSDKQLLYGSKHTDTASCLPEEHSNGFPVVPCGLIAWSLFNDTYRFSRNVGELKVNRKNIAWKSDRDHKFGKVFPLNFQNGTLIGGGNLDPNIPLSDQEDLIVWMRTAALPSFRKLYGRIEEDDLEAGDVIGVHLLNNYNTYSFGGKKTLVLSTSSWIGGKNDFLGMAYIFIGSSSIFISLVFLLIHVRNPRPYLDTSYLSWNR